jgi:NOL1/NOP2/sun family putative RNA methylase
MGHKGRVSDKVYGYLSSTFGDEIAKRYWEFVQHHPSKYIRTNILKTDREELAKKLEEKYSIITEPVKYPDNVLKMISGIDDIGSTFEIAFGFYYLQGLTSMFPPIVLNPRPNEKVLDLCSAPGSKSTQLAELMANKGTLVVNEIQLERVKALVFNLDKMSFLNYGVINSKGEILSKYYEEEFDKILVDAPCSGLGIIQKKSEVNKWWSIDRVNRLTDLQTRLLVASIKMLKPGGEVVYSTCSLTVEENELIIDKILKKYPVEVCDIQLPINHKPGFTKYQAKELNPDLKKAIRIFPWETDSDGFFLIKLRKTSSISHDDDSKWKKSYVIKLCEATDVEMYDQLSILSEEFGIAPSVFNEYKYIIKHGDIYFINHDWQDTNLGLFHRIGTKFGTIDTNRKIVFHSHAAQILQKHITKNIYEISDIEEARTYLNGGLIVNDSLKPGQYAVKYDGIILGTGVVIQGGLKSRFPRSKRTQRISLGRSQYLSEELS